jgi:Raf kinase inhibitor-like YbhB/YbcL family protein
LQVAIAILLLLAAGFWYKSSLQTQSQNKNQPQGTNNENMLNITSPAFLSNETIPAKYTCDGADINPPLMFGGIPEKAKSLVLIVDDPDASAGNWNHWVFWNVDPKVTAIVEDSIPSGAVLGTNSFGRLTYGGPCPPSGTHRYFFKLYALDTMLDLPEGSKKDDLEKAMGSHILEEANLIGRYERLR